ncbi:hypothetical protein [Micromonospora phytophila]|nr:hypothetical protein [Micromonospora phytophila]
MSGRRSGRLLGSLLVLLTLAAAFGVVDLGGLGDLQTQDLVWQ